MNGYLIINNSYKLGSHRKGRELPGTLVFLEPTSSIPFDWQFHCNLTWGHRLLLHSPIPTGAYYITIQELFSFCYCTNKRIRISHSLTHNRSRNRSTRNCGLGQWVFQFSIQLSSNVRKKCLQQAQWPADPVAGVILFSVWNTVILETISYGD